MNLSDPLGLLDYRRRVAGAYWSVRRRRPRGHAWEEWREARDELFRDHPQSALDESFRRGSAGLPYFAHDLGFRFEVTPLPHDGENRSPVAVRAAERL